MIIDEFNRTFKTLRISLTSACNFACSYCVSGTGMSDVSKGVSAEEMIAIITKLKEVIDIETIRLTGGEPLLYKNIEPVIRGIVDLGIQDIKMTTNAFLLKQKAKALAQAGIKSINISMDAVKEDRFFEITRRKGLNEVLQGIDEALDNGIAVKINSVIMRGKNDDQIIPLLKFAGEKGIPIRFLEVMKMGYLYDGHKNHLYTEGEILSRVSQKYTFKKLPRKASSTANYWITNTGYCFGVIANTSSPFCSDCNRLRLDSLGNIYGCISSKTGIRISSEMNTDELQTALRLALKQKQKEAFAGSPVSMKSIGG